LEGFQATLAARDRCISIISATKSRTYGANNTNPCAPQRKASGMYRIDLKRYRLYPAAIFYPQQNIRIQQHLHESANALCRA